jgi:hypothetical protein
VLVRHSVPEVDPARPAEEWRLSEEGRARCAALRGRDAFELWSSLELPDLVVV